MTAFPTTHATWLVRTVSEDPAAARTFVLDRYFHPLCAYVRSSQLRALGEPADLVNDFLAARLGDDAYLVRWSASGLPLRRWLANGLLIHTRNTVLAARRRRELLARGSVGQFSLPSDSVSADDLSNARTPPAHETDALLALERAWAIRAVTEAHERVRTELQAEGRAAWWELFRLHTIHAMAYAKAAPAVGIPLSSASSVHRQVVDRLREALVDILSRDGVAPDEVEREMALMQDLLGWSGGRMRGEIRSGASREFIPHAEVVQIGAAKDLVVSMSQLTLVRRHARLGRIVSTSRILYIRGEREQRDAHVRAARRWLEDRRRTTGA